MIPFIVRENNTEFIVSPIQLWLINLNTTQQTFLGKYPDFFWFIVYTDSFYLYLSLFVLEFQFHLVFSI